MLVQCGGPVKAFKIQINVVSRKSPALNSGHPIKLQICRLHFSYLLYMRAHVCVSLCPQPWISGPVITYSIESIQCTLWTVYKWSDGSLTFYQDIWSFLQKKNEVMLTVRNHQCLRVKLKKTWQDYRAHAAKVSGGLVYVYLSFMKHINLPPNRRGGCI